MNFIVGGGITPGQAAPSNMDQLLKAEELALMNYKNSPSGKLNINSAASVDMSK